MSILSCILPVLRLYLVGFKVLLAQLFSRPFKLPAMPRQDGRVAIVTGGSRGIGYEVVRHLASLGVHVIIAMPRQDGRVAIVTGGSRGIGYEVVRHLASLGVHVIIGGKDEREALTAVRRISEEHKEAKVEYQRLNLASLTSVRQFVQSFEGRDLPLHILVNNAAVMLVPEGRTEDGFEQHLGVNYLGHFLLTWLLLGKLKDCGKRGSCSRVVTVSSSAHRAGEVRLDDLNSSQCYSAHSAYCQSKLALLFFAAHLQVALEADGAAVSSCAVDPGMVDTALYRHLWPPLRLAQSAVARLLFRSPVEGAATALHCALSPTLGEQERGGGYWANGRREMTSPSTLDPRLQQSLWDASCRLVGVAQD